MEMKVPSGAGTTLGEEGRGCGIGESGVGGCAGRGRDGRSKLFLTVGYVLVYGKFYGRGLGGQVVDGTYNPFWVIKYPLRS